MRLSGAFGTALALLGKYITRVIVYERHRV